MYADYEGTVSYVNPYPVNPDRVYHLGDHIHGRLTIDVTLAEQVGPNAIATGARSVVGYGLEEPYFSPNFITGYPPADTSSTGSDSLTIIRGEDDGAGGVLDSYSINDDDGWDAVGVGLSVTAHDLLHTLDIRQSFDLKASDLNGPGEKMGGDFWSGREGVAGFVLSHLTLRPASCHASP